ncbi:MAG: AAA-like domain-containing protein [Thermosynechococcaceae cyanobacterium]
MDTVDEALAVIENFLKPKYLSAVQELVFRQCWLGVNYEAIAEHSGYDADYLRGVGARLWQFLSDVVGERITKNNLRSVLRQHVAQLQASQNQTLSSLRDLEFPDGPVPLNSVFYIERPLIETQARQAILRPGALIHTKAPQRMGKTSWLIRLLHDTEMQGLRTVRLNLRQADGSVLTSLDKFLRWFCANLARQLQLDPLLEDYWNLDLGSKVSCTEYIQHYLLDSQPQPLAIALDETSYLFEYPDIAKEFLPLLRFWHEEANNLTIWQTLRLVVVYATDLYIPLNIHQSPFNVGLALQLPEFTPDQVLDLAQRHSLSWQEGLGSELAELMSMVGGHPHLVRLALYYLSSGRVSFDQLLQEAPTQAGIYSDHLQSYLVLLQQHPDLSTAFRQVIAAEKPVRLETVTAYQLSRTGLVKFQGNEVVPGCELYRLYFCDRLV